METLTSREAIMKELIDQGDFNFSGFIQNEVGATPLVLFKYVAKYCGVSSYEANKITTNEEWKEKLAEDKYDGSWLRKAVSENGFVWDKHWDSLEEKMDFCYKYGDIPWGTSIAASGVILTEDNSNLPKHDGVIAYNGEGLEKEGYIKYDLLSINTLNQIEYFKGLNVDWNNNDDDKVWDTICNGETDFVFQFSSPGMKEIIKNVQPRSVQTLAEINALYRPGPINMGMVDKYEDMKHGKVELDENEQVLSDLLKHVFGEEHTGLTVFQEEVMKICQEGAGFSMSDADMIRKAMGKKKAELLMGYKDQFIKGWNQKKIHINGLGDFLENDEVYLDDGSTITAIELLNRINNGEEFVISDNQPNVKPNL